VARAPARGAAVADRHGLLAVPAVYLARGVPVLSRYSYRSCPWGPWLAWRALMLGSGGDRRSRPSRVRSAAGESRPGARSPPAPLVAALALAQNLFTWQALVRPQGPDVQRRHAREPHSLGRWVRPPRSADAVIAAPDIGALGYYGKRRVVDLAGLSPPEMVPISSASRWRKRWRGSSSRASARPEFLADRATSRGISSGRVRGPARSSAHRPRVAPNLGLARPGEVVYSFYRIDWAASTRSVAALSP